MKIDSGNKFEVGATQNGVTRFYIPGRGPSHLIRQDALNLAAWLSVIADPSGEVFAKLVGEIRGEKADLSPNAPREGTRPTENG